MVCSNVLAAVYKVVSFTYMFRSYVPGWNLVEPYNRVFAKIKWSLHIPFGIYHERIKAIFISTEILVGVNLEWQECNLVPRL